MAKVILECLYELFNNECVSFDHERLYVGKIRECPFLSV